MQIWIGKTWIPFDPLFLYKSPAGERKIRRRGNGKSRKSEKIFATFFFPPFRTEILLLFFPVLLTSDFVICIIICDYSSNFTFSESRTRAKSRISYIANTKTYYLNIYFIYENRWCENVEWMKIRDFRMIEWEKRDYSKSGYPSIRFFEYFYGVLYVVDNIRDAIILWEFRSRRFPIMKAASTTGGIFVAKKTCDRRWKIMRLFRRGTSRLDLTDDSWPHSGTKSLFKHH